MPQTTQRIKELARRRAPAGRPQPIALYEGLLWLGSWETDRIYGIDPDRWSDVEEVVAPGRPYGIAPLDGALHVVVSDGGEADDRYLYRFIPGQGFVADSKTACPQFTGSHLTSDGKRLYLCQAHERRIVALDENAHVAATFPLPTRIAGMGFGPNGTLFAISADAEFEELAFGALSLTEQPAFAAVAPMPFGARALAFDGSAWYTSDREVGDVVRFNVE
jgi:DNA-binding beta-propeller fold protein YncE